MLRLLTQLFGLERRTARGGQDRIDHGAGGHDDLANAAAGALVLAAGAAASRCDYCDEPDCGGLHIIGLGDAPPRRRATEGEADDALPWTPTPTGPPVPIRFRESTRDATTGAVWAAGEVAGFAAEIAEGLVARGVAEWVDADADAKAQQESAEAVARMATGNWSDDGADRATRTARQFKAWHR